MSVVVVTGAAGLIGAEAVRHYAAAGKLVVGIDNDMRSYFFGADASTAPTARALVEELGERYINTEADIRDRDRMERLFATYGSDIDAVVHAAGQPSHDWAAREPHTDFGINATATLVLLDATRVHAPRAAFVFTSTNKVYGDTPNTLPLVERETRWELPAEHPLYDGINETMSIDHSTHSLFGASKVAADVLVQEYGRYFGMRTATFRCGCLTGAGHAGAELHGFLAYLVRCFKENREYIVIGHKGKQVRDNIASVDVVTLLDAYVRSDAAGGSVYNVGGGRRNSCSVIEAIELCSRIAGRKLRFRVVEEPRVGDHIWYISDMSRARNDFGSWTISQGLHEIVAALFDVPSR